MSDMNYVNIVIGFVGGLGLFIYGMHIMASGLQKSAGSRMKRFMEALISNKLMGVLVGTVVTAIIQSSSATTVMVVGFVNAGVMTLTQSVGVIMGANIGTTVTSWLISTTEWLKFLSPTTFAPIAVGIGAVLVLFPFKARAKQVGEIIVGFGILFVGMATMSSAVSPLRSSQVFKDFFVLLGNQPLLAILAGTVVTAIIQSSSASVGILQSLAASGLIPWDAAVYIIMGQNIGTCVTAILSSIGAEKEAKSAAYIHLLFNIIGSAIFSCLAMLYFKVINPALGPMVISLTEISLVHTFFNITSTAILFPFANILVTIAKKMSGVKETPDGAERLSHLDDRILETPTFAIESCINEIKDMATLAYQNLQAVESALIEAEEASINEIYQREKRIDYLQQAITAYLIKLCKQNVTADDYNRITSLFHVVNDIERVGDHCENLAELSQFMIDEHMTFSDRAVTDLKSFISLTQECCMMSQTAFDKNSVDFAIKTSEMEQKIDTMQSDMRTAHMLRLANNECNTQTGIVFLDTLTNLERISDHALNIAESVLKRKISKSKQI